VALLTNKKQFVTVNENFNVNFISVQST